MDSLESTSAASKGATWWVTVLKRLGPSVLSLGFLAAAYVYAVENHIFDGIDLSQIQPEYLFVMVILRLVTFMVMGLILKSFANHWGIKLDTVEWYGLSVAGSLVNLMTPLAGGAAIRAGYLKLRHGLAVSRFVAVFAVTTLINYLISGVIGLASLVVLSSIEHVPMAWAVAFIFIGLIIAPILFMVIPIERLPLPFRGRLRRAIELALQGWQEIHSDPRLIYLQLSLAACLVLLQGAGLLAGLLGIGDYANFVETIFLGSLINAWRVTPGPGVGVQEAIGGAAAGLISINPVHGAFVVLLNRAANWVLLFSLGVVFSFLLSRRLGVPLAKAAESVRLSGQSAADEPPSNGS